MRTVFRDEGRHSNLKEAVAASPSTAEISRRDPMSSSKPERPLPSRAASPNAAEPPVREKPALRRYAYAGCSVLVAIGLRILLDRVFLYHHPYAAFYMAALLSAWYGGVGPAIASAMGGAAAIVALAFAPSFLDPAGASTLIGFEFYFIVSSTAIILMEAQRRAEQAAARNAALAQRRMQELEEATARQLRAEAETREARERLHEAQKLESIGILAGGIAHDFNNLLTGVMGSATLALDMLPAENPAHGMLEIVVASSSRAAELTNQLLAYAGKGSYMTDFLDLSEIARQAAESLRPTLSGSLEFHFELRKELPQLRADPSQIRQLATNLIENAAEAIGTRSGRITLRTDVLRVEDPRLYAAAAVGQISQSTYVVLQVEDTGEGIDPTVLPRIFDPFVTTRFTGRGLGLAAVSGIVRSLKGAVLVSTRQGVGSLFSVLFPVVEDDRK